MRTPDQVLSILPTSAWLITQPHSRGIDPGFAVADEDRKRLDRLAENFGTGNHSAFRRRDLRDEVFAGLEQCFYAHLHDTTIRAEFERYG